MTSAAAEEKVINQKRRRADGDEDAERPKNNFQPEPAVTAEA